MPDRIVRDELLESDRWLDLPTDASRLAFVGFLLIADDFGNIEGGPRRLFRFLHRFTQIKTEQHAVECIVSLIDCDLLRRYEVDKREFYHIPRFRPHRQYLVRRYPPSPWCDQNTELGKNKRVYLRGLAENVAATLLPRSNDVAEGVGVGVGELPSPRRKRPGQDSGLEVRKQTWQAYSVAFTNRYNQEPPDNVESRSAIKRFCAKIPGNECPGVAAFYVSHNSAFYVSKCHDPKLLAADAAKLRTEWANGHQVTQTQAMQADKRQANHGVFAKLIEEAENERKAKP